ncbi:protein-export membrane protein SecF [Leucobacter sp. OLJS4]|uniref:protein translocase subunit SecF n=1 Tax=unclassified Leucobacter TaxID=2621730 RepID=UPI000C175418|nr:MULTISPECIES: protein translocase subunit SecF [unclassified Leucobacter]PIJ51123.1 protein-export membrane protein SecF [Leucobacter sp. OLES1]PII81623.1 protein-export membrane protein SecF [Leucobacter sp. OLCALW19]PII86294.1 protein-export membrane protein SecF [Leucobacter sp. OLTLW20]PII90189.1 protein-export membrane protein SecF [Leucobacter sp. OLAS13]PII97222.1 protein-export membrane protein SecF [Leucobacter sp. OLDS2]
MARSFSEFGNALYTGEKSINFIGRWKTWFLVAAVMILISIAGPLLRGGFTFGIEFTGGSQFQVHIAEGQKRDQALATKAVDEVLPGSAPRVSLVGQTDIRVQTEQLKDAEAQEIRKALADAYQVDESEVTSSYIGALWGQDITRQAVIALGVFILFAALVMAIYFRTWKMSLAALIALFHDLIITAGVYGLTGFEITPAAMIGFLTILGYSLYDTVVVFDKIRENTAPGELTERRTFGQAVNLAVNQTLVRSINTSVVALLPVASILFIGAFVLGAGTLRDIALALFIGILVGAYSTIFIAAPTYALLRRGEPAIKKHDQKAEQLQADSEPEPSVV